MLKNLNLVVLRGAIANVPERRPTPRGSEITFNLSINEGDGGPITTAPVSCDSETLGVAGQGDEVLVVGRVRRLYFRVAGVTQSRTDVRATSISSGNDVVEAQAEITRRLTGGL